MFRKSSLVSVSIIIALLFPVADRSKAKVRKDPVLHRGRSDILVRSRRDSLRRTPNSGAVVSKKSGLADGFINPPLSARPAAYWVWVNGLTDEKQLTYELEEMKAKGLSGVYIFDVGAHDPKGIVPQGLAFMGPESLNAIGHAIREATRLGLEVGIVTSSSWNCGGPWVAPEYASMGLYHCQLTVKGPVQFSDILPFPAVPKKTPKGPGGLPVYYKNVAVLGVPEAKHDNKSGPQGSRPSDGAIPTIIENTDSIVDLTKRLDKNGRLVWNIPAGTWTIMRFVCANTGLLLKIPSPKSHGPAIDHFNSEATKMHFDYLISRLRQELGNFKDTALKHMYVCSYELSGSTWTPDFLEEFKKRRGYDMRNFLPVLSGSIVQDYEFTERFRYDYRKTLGDLLVDAFYSTAREMSNRHGLLLCAEAGGPGPPLHQVPVDALKALGALDIPRGEFWKEHDVWVVKETACASHIYGRKIVDMEAFTSWRHWQDGPFDIKPFADRALCGGANHFTFHTCAHNPPQAGLPGWVYHAGTHISPSLVWWPKARPFIDYLSRCSYLLQQGLFVADVCYYYGDQGFNFVPPKHVDPSLGYGYDYDVTNAEVILSRMDVRNGKIVLPDGMSYEVLILPDREDIDWMVLKKIERLVKAGATVVGRKPTRSNGLTDYPHRDIKVRNLANKLWGPCDGKKCTEHSYGKGRIIWGKTLRDILQARGIGPDFSFTSRDGKESELDYIHRRTKSDDIYFVRNKNECWELVDCVFRVFGKTPELWRPDTGRMHRQVVYDFVKGGTRVPLLLPPAGSVFVVFREKTEENHFVSLGRNNRPIFPAEESKPQELASIPHQLCNAKISTVSQVSTAAAGPIGAGPHGHDKFELQIFRSGTYTLKTAEDKEVTVKLETIPAMQEITGPWEVRFPRGWGAPESKVFDELISWTDDSEEGIRYFSGIATYYKELDIPADQLAADKQLFLDLGRVRFVAEVYLNAKGLGILWKPPFRVDITRAAKAGKNQLVIEVANTWSNRLVGDARAPQDIRYCQTNIANSLTWRVPWKDTPLIESGLLGPVRLIVAKKLSLRLPK